MTHAPCPPTVQPAAAGTPPHTPAHHPHGQPPARHTHTQQQWQQRTAAHRTGATGPACPPTTLQGLRQSPPGTSREPPPDEVHNPGDGGHNSTGSGQAEQGNEHPTGHTLYSPATCSGAVNPVHVLVVAVHSPAPTIKSRNSSSGTRAGCHTLSWSSQRTGYGSYCTQPSGVWSQNRCMPGSCSCIRSL